MESVEGRHKKVSDGEVRLEGAGDPYLYRDAGH